MKFKKIEVEWKDITLFPGNFKIKDIKDLELQSMKTIGHLIKEEKDYLIIAFSIEKTKPYNIIDLLKIPKTNIIKKRILK